MLKRFMALALACSLVFAFGCSKKASWELLKPPNISKIDLSVSENQKYIDWLDERDFNSDDEYKDIRYKEWDDVKKISDTEVLRSIKWNDNLTIELNVVVEGMSGTQKLAVSNMSDDTSVLIEEVSNDFDGDGYYDFVIISIVDDEHIVYQKRDAEGFGAVYMYTLNKNSDEIMNTKLISDSYNWGVGGQSSSIIYWCENKNNESVLYVADLKKMARNDKNAVNKVAEKDDKDVEFFYQLSAVSDDGRYLPILSRGKDWDMSLTLYDLVNNEEIYFAQLPNCGENKPGALVWADDKTQYYFEYADSVSEGKRFYLHGTDLKEKDLAEISFYELSYEF